MKKIQELFLKLEEPKNAIRYHYFWTVAWFLLIPISAFSPLAGLVAWVVLMSAWANHGSHWAAAQAAKGHMELMKRLDIMDAKLNKIIKEQGGRPRSAHKKPKPAR